MILPVTCRAERRVVAHVEVPTDGRLTAEVLTRGWRPVATAYAVRRWVAGAPWRCPRCRGALALDGVPVYVVGAVRVTTDADGEERTQRV